MLRRAATIALATFAACKPQPAPAPLDDDAPPPPAGTPAPANAPAESNARPAVVASVGGTEITRKQLDELRHVAPEYGADEALAVLVDRIVLAREAERLDVKVRDDEIEKAIEAVAKSHGMTVAHLRSTVADSTHMSWDEYRGEIGAQILEAKVLTYHGNVGSNGTASGDFLAGRDRLVSCLRADAHVEVDDPDLALPDNPYAREVKIEGAHFHGTLGMPEADLSAIVEKAAPSGSVCKAVTDLEPALLNAYLDAGYVKAKVNVRWPEKPADTMTLDIDLDSGPVHQVGKIVFDQAAVPKAQRADEKALRKTVEAHIRTGDVAVVSQLRAAGVALNEALEAAGLSPAIAETDMRSGKKGAVLDVTYVIAPKV